MSGELLDSDRVEEGEEEGSSDLMMSRRFWQFDDVEVEKVPASLGNLFRGI